MEPISLALSATQFGIGALQSLIGGRKARKAEKALESMKTPTYAPNKSINDYYSQALRKYNTSPYESPLYKMQSQNAQRATAQGISALQDRRSALAGVSNLVQGQNDAMLKASAVAEGQRNQNFNQLGYATQMKAGDDRMGFQYNQVAPYEKKYNLLAMKAGGGNQTMNAGMQNMFGGLQSAAQLQMAEKYYNPQEPK
jgi:hypothetical protein